jgi:hypothetical protein
VLFWATLLQLVSSSLDDRRCALRSTPGSFTATLHRKGGILFSLISTLAPGGYPLYPAKNGSLESSRPITGSHSLNNKFIVPSMFIRVHSWLIVISALTAANAAQLSIPSATAP